MAHECLPREDRSRSRKGEPGVRKYGVNTIVACESLIAARDASGVLRVRIGH